MEHRDATPMDVISVSAEAKEELRASSADLYVAIVGESFFTGSAALKKTKEVHELVAALKAAGVDEKDVHLQSVRAVASTGILRKSSSARYHLRVHCTGLETVGEAVGAITAQKNTDLRPIVWRYAEGDGVRDRLLDAATRTAHDRARRIAANLGIRLAGVHRFAETFHDPEQYAGDPFALEAMASSIRRRTIDKVIDLDEMGDPGMSVSHLKDVRLRVEVDYYVSDYLSTALAEPPA